MGAHLRQRVPHPRHTDYVRHRSHPRALSRHRRSGVAGLLAVPALAWRAPARTEGRPRAHGAERPDRRGRRRDPRPRRPVRLRVGRTGGISRCSRSAMPGQRASSGDWLFVIGCCAVVVVVALLRSSRCMRSAGGWAGGRSSGGWRLEVGGRGWGLGAEAGGWVGARGWGRGRGLGRGKGLVGGRGWRLEAGGWTLEARGGLAPP